MAPAVKVRLEIDGTPEALAAVRAFTAQTKAAGKEASASFAGLSTALSGVTKLFVAYKIANLAVATALFTAETVKLAAAQKDLALSLGTTIRNFSALAAVGKATNTEQSKLVAGLGALADKIKDLREGSPEVVKSFRQLGLSAKDFASDDIVVNASKIADALEKVARGGSKGAIATETLGKNGRALVPVFEKLNELGGLEGATAFAKQLGVLVDSQTVAIFDKIASTLQEIELSARGVALAFAKGFGPDALVALQDIQRLFGDVKPEAEALGKAIGLLARVMAELAVQAVAFDIVMSDLASGQFQKAKADIEKFSTMLKEMRAAEANVKPVDDTVGAPPPGAVTAAAAAAAAAKRLALEQKLAELTRQLFDATDRVLEAKLKAEFDAGLVQLDDYYKKRIEIIENAFIREQNLKLKLAASLPEGSDEQKIAQREAAIIDQQRVAAVQNLNNELEAAREPVKNLGTEIRKSLTGALTEFATTGILQVNSLADAFRRLGSAIASALVQTLGSDLVSRLPFLAAGKAGGGLISGPGTGTSDSVPLWGSTGEYMVRASSVAQPGMLPLLEMVNRGLPPGAGELIRRNLSMQLLAPRGYADGGLIEPAARSSEASVGGQISIGLDAGLVLNAIESPEGQRVLLKVISKNPRAFSAAVRR